MSDHAAQSGLSNSGSASGMNAVSSLVNLGRSFFRSSGSTDQEVPATQPKLADVVLTHWEHDGKEYSLPSVVTGVKENGDFTACVLMNDGDDPQPMNDEPENWEDPQTGLNLGNMHTDPKKGYWRGRICRRMCRHRRLRASPFSSTNKLST